MISKELLAECQNEFELYFQSLKINSTEIKHKIEDIKGHSLRVAKTSAELSKTIAELQDQVYLPQIIALVHDLGKAEMIVQGTESATNILRDHASTSVSLIQQMSFFQKIPADIQPILLKAVENHNKIKLPKLDNEQELVYAKLLRDADKLDIYESSYKFFKERFGTQPLVTLDLLNQTEISNSILKSIMAGKPANLEDMKTMNDYKLALLAMAFDLNFKASFKIMSERQYIQKIYETLPKRDQIIDAYRMIKLFVENKFVA